MITKRVKKLIAKTLLYICCTGVGMFLLIIIIAFSWMRFEVQSNCKIAQEAYKGDCINALGLLLLDEKRSFHERNSAIWALGQMANKKALPTLKKLYTGKIPNREPLDKTISQYELRKAIKWCTEGNSTSWMYKAYNR